MRPLSDSESGKDSITGVDEGSGLLVGGDTGTGIDDTIVGDTLDLEAAIVVVGVGDRVLALVLGAVSVGPIWAELGSAVGSNDWTARNGAIRAALDSAVGGDEGM